MDDLKTKNKKREIQKLENDNSILSLSIKVGKKNGIPIDELSLGYYDNMKKWNDSMKKYSELRIEIEKMENRIYS